MQLTYLRAVIVGTMLVLFAGLAACTLPSKSPSGGSGQPAPQFSLPNLDGKQIQLKDFSNKVVIVDFWATWCAPCREEIPHLNRLYQDYRGRGFEIIGISMDTDEPANIKKFTKEFRMEYTVVIGNEGVAQDFGGILGYPTTIIIDRKGNMVKKYTGFQPSFLQEMERTIKELLG
jgi:cytochrome c biogenesis protein CcmG, thiol:disulfide interchange protein DsbE